MKPTNNGSNMNVNPGDLDLAKVCANSTSGGVGKRGAATVKIRKDKFKKAVVKLAALVAAVVIAACALGNVAFDKISKSVALSNAKCDFHYEFVAPQTLRTEYNEYSYYDYSTIYHKMCEKYSETAGLYLFYLDTDKSLEQLKRMVNEGMPGDIKLEDYLYTHGFESLDEWEKAAKKITLMELEDNDLHKELGEILGEHDLSDPPIEGEYGGGQKWWNYQV